MVGCHRDRIDNHTAFGFFDLGNFVGLLLHGQVFMDDTDAALLRHGNGGLGLGNGIHGRTEQRHIERDIARKPGANVGI